MKKLRIKKCMTSFLMLAVMVVSIIGVIPKAIVYADAKYNGTIKHSSHFNHSYSYTDSNGNETKVTYNLGTPDNNNIYLIEFSSSDYSNFYFASYGDFSGTVTYESDGYSTSKAISCSAFECGKYGRIYCTSPISDVPSSFPHLKYNLSELNELYDSGKLDLCGGENMEAHFCAKVCNYEGRYKDDAETVIEAGDGVPDGSQDNPMEDKDIGTIVLKSHGFIPTKNNNFSGDVSGSYDYYFKYKDKTSSGFSISDNKYARTFIQIRVQNQCVLFEPGDEDTVKEYYPHYGEFYQYKNLATENISNNTVKVSWGEVMSKWSDYTEHPLAINKKLSYRFMLRVICTDSLTVVPDESSGWYAGGWRSFIFDGDKFLEETNGHVDGDGNWSDDEDDGYNDSSDKTTNINQDKDDVDDLLNDDSSDSGSSNKLNISNIKAFMKEVGNVPKAIGKLFSFLPDWVTTFIGFGFVVLVALIIIKAIRG